MKYFICLYATATPRYEIAGEHWQVLILERFVREALVCAFKNHRKQIIFS